MAKDYVIRLDIDDSGAIAAIEPIKKGLDQAEESATSLKAQLRSMQKELQNLDPQSKAFADLSKKAGDLKDKINDASEAIRANAGSAFQSLSNNASNLGQRFLELDFEGVGQSFRGIAGAVGQIKISDLTNQLKGAVGGFAQLGKALLANPIFLLGAAVAALITNFKEIKELLDVGVNPATRAFVEETRKASEASKAAFESFDLEERRLRALGVAESEIAAQRKIATKERIESLKSELAAQNILLGEQVKRNAIASATAGTSIGGAILSLFSPSDEEVAETKTKTKELAGQIAELDVVLLELDKKQTDSKKAESVKRTDIDKEEVKSANDLLIERKLQADRIVQLSKDINEKIRADAKANQQQDRLQITDENDKKFELLKQQQDLELQFMADGQAKEIALSDQKYIKLREQAVGNADLQKQLAEANAKEVEDIQKKYADAEIANQKRLNDNRVQLASGVLGSLLDLNNSFTAQNQKQAKKQFQINKGLQIAQALIQTYQSATGAYASQLVVGDVTSPIRAALAAGIAIVSGLAQVNKIRQTQFDSNGASGGGGGGGSTPSISGGGGGGGGGVPAFNPVDTSFLGNRPPQPQPAYVLASAVNSAQEAREKTEDLARL